MQTSLRAASGVAVVLALLVPGTTVHAAPPAEATISIVGGGGSLGLEPAPLAEGMSVLDAQIKPLALAVGAGKTYFYDSDRRAVYSFASDGAVHLVAGGSNTPFVSGGVATEHGLPSSTSVSDIAVEPDGTVYLSFDGDDIARISTSGIISTLTAPGPIGHCGSVTDGVTVSALDVCSARRLALDGQGRVVFAHDQALLALDPTTDTVRIVVPDIAPEVLPPHNAGTGGVEVANNGDIIVGVATPNEFLVRRFDASSGALLQAWTQSTVILNIEDLGDGRLLAVGDEYGADPGYAVTHGQIAVLGADGSVTKWAHASAPGNPVNGTPFATSPIGPMNDVVVAEGRILIAASSCCGQTGGYLIELSAVTPPGLAPSFAPVLTHARGAAAVTLTWDASTVGSTDSVRAIEGVGRNLASDDFTAVLASSGHMSVALADADRATDVQVFLVRTDPAVGISHRNVVLPVAGWSVEPIAVSKPVLESMTPPHNGWRPTAVSATFTGVAPGPIECRLDTAAWASCPGGLWSASGLSAGSHTVRARMNYPVAGPGPELAVPFGVESTVPTATIVSGPTLIRTSTTTRWWSARDSQSGVEAYSVRTILIDRYGRTSALEYPAGLQGTTITHGTFAIPAGSTRCWQVKARDRVGNWGGWSPRACSSKLLDERSVGRGSGWSPGTSSAAYERTVLVTSRRGARLWAGSTRSEVVGLVMRTCSACGSVRVLVNGRSVATYSLASSRTREGVVFTTALGASTSARSVTFETLGTGVVRADAVVLQRYH